MPYLPLLVMMLPLALPAGNPDKPMVRSLPSKPHCVRPELRQTARERQPGIRKLGDLPPAKPIYTVLREVDGCPTPVAVQRR